MAVGLAGPRELRRPGPLDFLWQFEQDSPHPEGPGPVHQRLRLGQHVVGDLLGEARQQLRGAVLTDAALALAGGLVAAIVAMGLGF